LLNLSSCQLQSSRGLPQLLFLKEKVLVLARPGEQRFFFVHWPFPNVVNLLVLWYCARFFLTSLLSESLPRFPFFPPNPSCDNVPHTSALSLYKKRSRKGYPSLLFFFSAPRFVWTSLGQRRPLETLTVLPLWYQHGPFTSEALFSLAFASESWFFCNLVLLPPTLFPFTYFVLNRVVTKKLPLN